MRLTFAIALLTAVLLAPSAHAAAPVATASKTCSVGDQRSYGTTYVTAISVRNTAPSMPAGPARRASARA
jgi:hypothetical protein